MAEQPSTESISQGNGAPILGGIRVVPSEALPPNSIMVSRDVYDMLKRAAPSIGSDAAPDAKPTDAMLDAMRRNGLSIAGDNAYKRDLIDCIIGTLMLGKQGANPPPPGHWAEQFWHMARAEGEIQENLAAVSPSAEQPEPVKTITPAARDVLAERRRQVEAEGWSPEHDDEHGDGQMAVAAGYYALACGYPHERDIGRGHVPAYWPWDRSWWKPKGCRSNLIRAGALILAEIERIDRALLKTEPKQ